MAKNIILGAIAAVVLAPTAALAADMAVKAPVPVAIYDWTGFYIGASGGGSLGNSDHIDAATGLSDAAGYNIRGGMVGGTIGYNWQVSSFVVGFEGDYSWVSEYGSNSDIGAAPVALTAAGATNLFNGAGSPSFQSFTKETWLATARVRVGYAVNNLLFYGTGGYAAAGVQAGVKDSGNNALLASASSTRSGWAAGGGLEWGFAPNWSAKFEMLYTQFEDKPFFTLQAEGPRSAVPLNDTAARFGINYRFGGGPVVARY
jgi:outer membrane immunogenic protein